MADLAIHIFPNPLAVSGTFTAQVLDNAGSPADVIEAGLDFQVKCDWTIDKDLAKLLGGTWHVDLYAESIGQGFEGRVAGDFEPVVPGQTSYTKTFTVPADTFADDTPVHPLGDYSGVYKMSVVLTHHNGAVTTSICAVDNEATVLIR